MGIVVREGPNVDNIKSYVVLNDIMDGSTPYTAAAVETTSTEVDYSQIGFLCRDYNTTIVGVIVDVVFGSLDTFLFLSLVMTYVAVPFLAVVAVAVAVFVAVVVAVAVAVAVAVDDANADADADADAATVFPAAAAAAAAVGITVVRCRVKKSKVM